MNLDIATTQNTAALAERLDIDQLDVVKRALRVYSALLPHGEANKVCMPIKGRMHRLDLNTGSLTVHEHYGERST